MKRQTLSDVATGSRKLPNRVLFHGLPGIGKTSWAAQAPSPLDLLSPGETGLHTLMDSGIVPTTIPNIEVADWESLIGLVRELQTSDHKYRCLVLDTIDGFIDLANRYVCRTMYGGDMGEAGFMSYQRGYESVAMGPTRELLSELDKLRELRGMGIILLAHCEISNFKNPEGPDYDRYMPAINKRSWKLIQAWSDIVLFGTRVVHVEKERADRKAKAQGGDVRIMETEHSATADAKNRHNLPPVIEMGNSPAEAWANFISALKHERKPTDA